MGSGEAADRVHSGRAQEEEWLWRRRGRRELETGESGWARGGQVGECQDQWEGEGMGGIKEKQGVSVT